MKPIKFYFSLLLFSPLLFSCGNEDVPLEANTKPVTTQAELSKDKLQLLKVNSKSKEVPELISGRVIAKNQTQIFAEVQGLLQATQVAMKAGQRFKSGTQLIQIESKEFTLGLKSQKSAFLNALTGIMPDLKSDYSDNFQVWLNYLSTVDIEKPLPNLPSTKSESEKFFVTSRGIYTSFYSLKAQEERLKKYSIYAPYNGIVTQGTLDVGGLVTPGQLLGTIISSDSFELETGVSLAAGSQLKVGDAIDFTSNEMPGNWVGKVVRIGGVVDPQTQNIPVYFSIRGKGVLPGMYLQGQYQSNSFENVFVIPTSIISRDQEVLILEKEVIVNRSIQTIETFQDSSLVKGLKENDQVILTQFAQPMAGKKVKL